MEGISDGTLAACKNPFGMIYILQTIGPTAAGPYRFFSVKEERYEKKIREMEDP
jgi:hypothetical protein